MTDFILNAPYMLVLLPLVAIFALLQIYKVKKVREDIRAFAGASDSRISRSALFDKIRLYLLCASVLLIIFAMCRPAWNPHPKLLHREGRDVVFILDVSNSMLCEDIFPSRLARAKIAIGECVDSLVDNRIGLVVFAGSASIKCPLTLDHDFFHYMLDKVGPDSVDHGGTRLADAVIKTCDKLFSDSQKGYKDIILITDGGDQGGGLKKAAELLNQHKVKLIAIGIGDDKNGAKVPLPGKSKNLEYMKYKGKYVISRLDNRKLREFVKMCRDGAYIHAGTKNMHLDRIYKKLNTVNKQQLLSEDSVKVYDEKYQIFLASALALLFAMVLLPITYRPSKAILLIFLFTGTVTHLFADDQPSGDTLYLKGNYPKAKIAYEQELKTEKTPRLYYNLGNTCCKMNDFEKALEYYTKAVELEKSPERLKFILYNQANVFLHLSETQRDLEDKLFNLNTAITLYRKVLFYDPGFNDAAFNMELAERQRLKAQREIEKENKRNQEFADAIKKIKEQLEEIIDNQGENLNNTKIYLNQQRNNQQIASKKKVDINAEKRRENQLHRIQKSLLVLENKIEKDTSSATELITATSDHFFKGIPKEIAPFCETLKYMKLASEAEKTATEKLNTAPADAVKPETSALDNCRKALAALPSKPQQKQDDQESSEQQSDQDQLSDEESNETENEQMPSSNSYKMDLKQQEVPPPNETPEDVLKKDQKIQEMRQGKRSKKHKSVKMDW